MLSVKAPATSANLGPGFDCLGIAFDIYDEIDFSEEGEGLVIKGCDPRFAGADNLAYRAYLTALEAAGEAAPRGMRMEFRTDIPVSSGLGSSAALITAGLFAADRIRGLGMSREDLLTLANGMEGHPDNVAPCIYGGLTAALMRGGRPVVAQYPVSPELRFTALITDLEVPTDKARAILPDSVPRRDAVYTAGCLSLLMKGLETGDGSLLSAALDDRLHQPYRKQLIPGFEEIKKAAEDCGAFGLVISGSGSTLLAVGGAEGIDKEIGSAVSGLPGNWRTRALKVDTEGVR